MDVAQALEIAGVTRVIWIDDRFNETPEQVARMFTNNLEISRSCEFPELSDALARVEYDPEGVTMEIAQILTDLPSARFQTLKAAFFEKEGAEDHFATKELSAETVETACQLLGVAAEDRWTFDEASNRLPELCAGGDAHLSYVVDLNETGGSPTRGLDILRSLWSSNSAGTAFILTHETDTSGEGQTEIDLRGQLSDIEGLGLPICVIAKERLFDKAADTAAMAEALRIGLKRAGLRRSLHEVLSGAQTTLKQAADEALKNLLSIPPEKLESHVFERGFKEGVSELHVVERAITAHLGKQTREFFGTDPNVHASTERLRAFRGIKLEISVTDPDPYLRRFREAEVWESSELLNKALTPLACGDVFELDPEEEATKSIDRKYVLLGQPCDISLRPEGKERGLTAAILVPVKVRTDSTSTSEKVVDFPFALNNTKWVCDFRAASAVQLSVLDLASFRSDGRVRVDDGQVRPASLLVGQQKVYESRTEVSTKIIAGEKPLPADGLLDPHLTLTFSTIDEFKFIHMPVLLDGSRQKINKRWVIKPKRLTWRLRRCGRVRMPYAAALLESYTSIISRHAFDVDYMA